MQTILNINTTTCIQCTKCVQVCPSQIFKQISPNSPIELFMPEACIVCGHCVAVCPTKAVEHAHFQDAKVHPIDYKAMPTAEQLMLLCKARRSNRAFSEQAIPEEMLTQILEAAHRAPTASNSQQLAFTLVTDTEALNQISDFTLNIFSSIIKKISNPIVKPLVKAIIPKVLAYIPAFQRLLEERKKGNDLILRNATAVLFIHAPKSSRFACQDANLAYQNASLMAEVLGVSQFYTGFVCSATQQAKGKLEKQLHIEGVIHAGMALGMPKFRYPNYIDRKDIDLNRI